LGQTYDRLMQEDGSDERMTGGHGDEQLFGLDRYDLLMQEDGSDERMTGGHGDEQLFELDR
jgi:hypothetical protein